MIDIPKQKPAVWIVVGVGLLWILLFVIVVWPLAMLLISVLRQFNHPEILLHVLSQIGLISVIFHSLWTSALATLLGIGIGFGIAKALTMLGNRLSKWGHVAALLPLLIPPFVGAFSWVQAYAKAGTTDWLLHWYWPGLYGPMGVIVLLAVHSSPIAYLAMKAVFTRIDHTAERAARIHGANAWVLFRMVKWPVLRPALLAATGLILAYNLGDFGIPFELGTPAHFDTATTQIYAVLSTESTGGLPAAIVLSLVLSMISLAVLVFLQRLNALHSVAFYHLSVRRDQRKAGNLSTCIAVLLLALYTVFAVILPFFSTLLVGLTRAYGLTPVPRNWDLSFLIKVFASDTGIAAWHSLVLAGAAALFVAGLSIMTAEYAKRTRWGSVLNKIAWIPYALPGTVVGVSAILGLSRIMYGSMWIILIAYIGRFWGLGDSIVQVRRQVPSIPQNAARIFGGTSGMAYRIAVWPYLSASVAMTALMVFVGAVYELTISSLLYTPTSETMAVVVMSANQAGDVRTTAMISVWMTLIMVIAVFLFTGLQNCAQKAGEFVHAGVESKEVG